MLVQCGPDLSWYRETLRWKVVSREHLGTLLLVVLTPGMRNVAELGKHGYTLFSSTVAWQNHQHSRQIEGCDRVARTQATLRFAQVHFFGSLPSTLCPDWRGHDREMCTDVAGEIDTIEFCVEGYESRHKVAVSTPGMQNWFSGSLAFREQGWYRRPWLFHRSIDSFAESLWCQTVRRCTFVHHSSKIPSFWRLPTTSWWQAFCRRVICIHLSHLQCKGSALPICGDFVRLMLLSSMFRLFRQRCYPYLSFGFRHQRQSDPEEQCYRALSQVAWGFLDFDPEMSCVRIIQ